MVHDDPLNIKYCIECGEYCEKLNSNPEYAYCCICLPFKYRTKHFNDYACRGCKESASRI